jgi:oligopeptide transport system permease protein
MLFFAGRRLLGVIPTLLVTVTLAFFMIRLAPGGPFDAQRRLPAEVEQHVAASYDLDKPLYGQYLAYLGQLSRLDLARLGSQVNDGNGVILS